MCYVREIVDIHERTAPGSVTMLLINWRLSYLPCECKRNLKLKNMALVIFIIYITYNSCNSMSLQNVLFVAGYISRYLQCSIIYHSYISASPFLVLCAFQWYVKWWQRERTFSVMTSTLISVVTGLQIVCIIIVDKNQLLNWL